MTYIRDLGVIVDEKLRFEEHISEKINKAYSMLGIIKRNFKYLDSKSFVMLYKSMVRNYLEYAVSVWSPSKKGVIEMIEKVQKRATKMIANCKDLCYINRLKLLKLPTLKYRRLRGDMVETFKILSAVYDVEACPTLRLSSITSTRGNCRKLDKELCQNDLKR